VQHLTLAIQDDSQRTPEPFAEIPITCDLTLPTKKLNSLQDFFEWLRNNPDFLAMLIAAIIAAIAPKPSAPGR